MPVIIKQWEVAQPITPEIEQELINYPPIVRQILYNRNIFTRELASRFLEAKLSPDIHAEKLHNIPKAIHRIRSAITNNEKIIVYGDYDADGVTATAILVLALKGLGANVLAYIPKRFDEGYGLNLDALRLLHEEAADLIITVDCGIRSIDEAAYAQSVGMDLIITDHHLPQDVIPKAFAVINPKQPKDKYPDKNLAGVGVAYKLAEALLISDERSGIDPHDYLDLVAIGTIADMVPLIGENRELVRAGLDAIRHPHRQGIMGLIGVSGLRPEHITATDIGFAFGPRLNAAGRLESAKDAYKLLISQDYQEVGLLAQSLEKQNRERQKIMRDIQTKAEMQIIVDDQIPLLLFAADPEYNAGVVGLAASRLTEKYYRPSIVACIGDKYTRGSCRSIPELHITQALDQCKDVLEHHGGHAAAAGFTVQNELLPTLIERLRVIVAEKLADKDLRPKIHAEAEVKLSDLNSSLLEYLDLLQPTGMDNPEPIFKSTGLLVENQRAVGSDLSHLKLRITDGYKHFDAIAFRQGHWIAKLPQTIDIMYTFERNEFNGQISLQLNVKDIKASPG